MCEMYGIRYFTFPMYCRSIPNKASTYGIKKMEPATIIMLMRGLLFLIPSFHLLPMLIGTEGIWLSTPLAEALTFAMTVLSWRVRKRGVSRCGIKE